LIALIARHRLARPPTARQGARSRETNPFGIANDNLISSQHTGNHDGFNARSVLASGADQKQPWYW